MGGDAEQCGAMASQDDNGSWKAGSIAERRAARCGFSLTPRLNTVRFRGVSPVSSPAARSPYLLTIPPGLSPAALLDSPVLLSNSQSQASPSIGKIRWLHVDQEVAASDEVAPPISCLQSDESQSLVHSSILADNLISAEGKNEFMDIVNQEIEFGAQVFPPFDGVTVEPPLLNGDQTELCPSAGKRADEYNWRKYGQKHVKGSEYPRSYYKCTYPSCPVKKKVERSYDGQITGIIYRGTHNHPIPQPARRSAFGMPCEISDATMGQGSSTNKDEEPILSSKQGSEYKNGADWSSDGPSSSTIVTELSESLSTAQEKHPDLLKLTGTQEIPSTLTKQIDEEDVATQGTRSIEDDSEDPEIDSKRMKKGAFLIETSSTSRSVHEQKVVVQAISEVDILDDGYRWRKYGQKVVKGNPNPRSYYKCTNPGCSVKKHVERASHDLKSVITTYAGKHNHGVPVARNNNEISSCFNMQPASNAQTPGTLPGSANLLISDLRVFQHIENKPEFGSGFKPGYTESVIVNPLAGTSLCYNVKPSHHLQHMHLNSFGVEINPMESYHASSIANIARDYQVSIPAELYRPNISLSSNDLNQGRFNFSESQPFLPHHQPREGSIIYKQPHQEVKNEIYTTPVSAPSDSPAFTDGQYFGGSPM